ncbi:hypothetical protein ASD64_14050 [Mesorhizobium sp. Root157]|nr:hypothetical protein ASD64_14050 [Mesorhizobium sp. Root157]
MNVSAGRARAAIAVAVIGPTPGIVISRLVAQHRYMRRSLGRDPTIFGQMTSDGVDQLGALPNQQIACSEHQGICLLRLALYCHEPHARTLRSLADCLSIDRIILVPLHE